MGMEAQTREYASMMPLQTGERKGETTYATSECGGADQRTLRNLSKRLWHISGGHPVKFGGDTRTCKNLGVFGG